MPVLPDLYPKSSVMVEQRQKGGGPPGDLQMVVLFPRIAGPPGAFVCS
jgi:hypothetical protein